MNDQLVLSAVEVAALFAELCDPYEPLFRDGSGNDPVAWLRSKIYDAMIRGQDVVITPAAFFTPLPDPRPTKSRRGRPSKPKADTSEQ